MKPKHAIGTLIINAISYYDNCLQISKLTGANRVPLSSLHVQNVKLSLEDYLPKLVFIAFLIKLIIKLIKLVCLCQYLHRNISFYFSSVTTF